MEASSVGYFFPIDFENVVQRSSMRAAQHNAIYPPRNPPLPSFCFRCLLISEKAHIFLAWRKPATYGS